MATIPQLQLFTWREIERSSDLDRLRLVLVAMPDERLVSLLEARRGRGRNDYPIRPMWNALLAGIVFQHPSAASLLRELWRNGELRGLCGFEPCAPPPSADGFGRFLALVVSHRAEVRAMFDALIDAINELLPDLGRRQAIDSKAIASLGKPVKDESKQNEPDGRRDLDADWGKKEYKGVHKDGTLWSKLVKWFGYKLHLLVDADYELPIAFALTKASEADVTQLPQLVEQLEEKHPALLARAEELSADKAYDSGEVNAALYDDHGIKPVIDTRRLWKEDPSKPRVLFDERYDVFAYDERGKVYCSCPQSGKQRELFFAGFEKDRAALKYRCPAAANGFVCIGRAECESLAPDGVGAFGRVVRVPLAHDRRIFTPIARHTAKWEKAYDRRPSVERVNSRIDRVLGFEQHFIRGQAKMEMRVSLALAVLLAMALGRIRAGQTDLMRSLTAPVRKTGS